MNIFSPPILLASWFGSGFLKPAPGTWGSLAALPFGAALIEFTGLHGLLIAALALIPVGTWATSLFQQQSGVHDDKRIVIDEVIGQWIAMLPIALLNPLYIALAFILFRFFDILKPWPISYIDKHVDSAFGVILDDILAGIAAGFVLAGVMYYVG